MGPSGTGKIELMLKLLKGKPFNPKIGTVLHIYNKMQPAFSEKLSSREVIVKFMKFNGLET